MRTNIDLDEALVRQALKCVPARSKKELVHQALRELVANHCRKDFRDIRGKIRFARGYDYKALRAAPERT